MCRGTGCDEILALSISNTLPEIFIDQNRF